ncbi:hypothetical protein SAY86_000076 [Trapa natans]|uniref:Ubiquitin carboxyl-terminal hydrolase n=1 Tax=Trapa natans TaxID=22666 RepID=A0AAN7RMJ0_TRANT|nr:hypothetical protein SAY86_000076 [Trapa natans]
MVSFDILGEDEDSPHSIWQLCVEMLDDPPTMCPPVTSPDETLTAIVSPPGFSVSLPETSSKDQQPVAGRLSDLTASTSNQSLLLTYGPPEPPLRSGLQIQHCRNQAVGVGAGLRNLGSTCFVNAILQCLTHTVPLFRGLQSLDHANPCYRAREEYCVLCALHDHIAASLESSGGIISPRKIVENLKYISSYFEIGQQEDAHEFLQMMMNKLEQCCLHQKWDPNSAASKNIVEEVFGGLLLSKLQCCNCGHCCHIYENLIDLSLEINHAETLTSALESFTNIEKMEEPESKFICENCNTYVSGEKQLLIEKEPTIAAFHLKRFKGDYATIEKIDKYISFPLELDLLPFTNGHESCVELKYHLYAVVVHLGLTPTFGHYICYVRSSPGIWHKFDDSEVVRVQEDFVLSQEAYILFYAKHDTPWFSSLMEERMNIKDNLISGTSPKSVLDKADTPYSPYVALSNAESSAFHKTDDNSLGISTLPLDPSHTFLNFESSFFHEAAGMGFSAPCYSRNCIQGKEPSEASSRSTTLQYRRKNGRSNCRRQWNKSCGNLRKKEAIRYMRGMPAFRAFQLYKATVNSRSPCPEKGLTKRMTGASLYDRDSPPAASQDRSMSDQSINISG